jgi:uncharacterized membrane protein
VQLPNDVIIQIAGWLIGIVGALLIFCGGLAGYIFNRHVRDNDVQFGNNREDHKVIFERLDGKRK